MAHIQFIKKIKQLFQVCLVAVSTLFLLGCNHSAPKHVNDACSIYREFPDWLAAGKQARAKWGTPLSLQLAIIYTESRFKAKARPRRDAFHIFNKSSARGYAQALNSVWRLYVHSTHKLAADRENFVDASDFIGWYTHMTKKRFGLPYSNGYAHYLAFHEGWGGYAAGSYKRNRRLVRIAKKVQVWQRRYHRQLLHCGRHARRRAYR